MPSHLEDTHFQRALAKQPLPEPEKLAPNPGRLDTGLAWGFEHDALPVCDSPSDFGEDDSVRHPALEEPLEVVLEENKDLLVAPLSDEELLKVAEDLKTLYRPGLRFHKEASREYWQLEAFGKSCRASPRVKNLLWGEKGKQRRVIIARHIVRKRWEHLGIWNPEWGIPREIDTEPDGCIAEWKWTWQAGTEEPGPNSERLVMRVVQQRKGLSGGDQAPLPGAHSALAGDVSASDGESFITSRPWFLFDLESAEFSTRMKRLPLNQCDLEPAKPENNVYIGEVVEWWKQRGHWNTGQDMPGDPRGATTGWRWPFEALLGEWDKLPLLNSDGMDYSPSEIDALEAIPPPNCRDDMFPGISRYLCSTAHLRTWEYLLLKWLRRRQQRKSRAERPRVLGYEHEPSKPLLESSASDAVEESAVNVIETSAADAANPRIRRRETLRRRLSEFSRSHLPSVIVTKATWSTSRSAKKAGPTAEKEAKKEAEKEAEMEAEKETEPRRLRDNVHDTAVNMETWIRKAGARVGKRIRKCLCLGPKSPETKETV